MSASNETSTIGLSQYISTDKPTYLVDYNGDMLKIDNAIAADRESIAGVNTVAERADGKADTNKTSIDTLNEQINGVPTDPSDTGLAGKVTDNSSDIETMQSLIGNGTPTTSNQTIIGAINGLEGAVAPREDGADLANSYAIGEQFARGGSVYTALTSLTAGTAFASLTLNTDYKVSDTLVEQIAEVKNTHAIKNTATITINADSIKTWAELIDTAVTSLNSVISALGTGEYLTVARFYVFGVHVNIPNDYMTNTDTLNRYGSELLVKTDRLEAAELHLVASGSYFHKTEIISSGGTVTYNYIDEGAVVPTTGTVRIDYVIFK